MVENTETEIIKEKTEKISGLSIAALVLGIISIVLWCIWIISIPCAILALVFGILEVKKPKRGMAIAGIVTGIISLVIWAMLFLGAFIFTFMGNLVEEYDYYGTSYFSDQI